MLAKEIEFMYALNVATAFVIIVVLNCMEYIPNVPFAIMSLPKN